MRKKFFSMLVLLAAVATGAWAQTETLLTTITATAKEQASYSTANVATVSFSYTSGGSSAYLANWGWWGYGWIATVTAAEGYTITKCIFYDDANRTATDSEAPFVVETTEEDKTPRINGTPIDGGNNWSKGIKKIEVYGYVTPTTVDVTGINLDKTEASMTVGGDALTLIPTVLPAEATDKSVTWSSSDEAVATVTDGVVTAVAAGTATITVTTTDGAKTATCAVTVAAPAASTYTVTLKEGTEDATSWTIAPAEATTTGVEAGTEVKATYGGTKKVKSVKAKKKAAAAAYTMAANATAGDVGKLICTDGHIHTYNADAACTKSRVAMIAYVGSETGVAGYTHGLALALTDESSSGMYWNDAKTACTNKNTSATVESASWMLPSKDQWNKMIDACKNVLGTNNDSQDLRDGFTSVGGSNLESQDYWSSTEYVYSNEAWMFNFGYDSWYDYPKDEAAYPLVRACLAF